MRTSSILLLLCAASLLLGCANFAVSPPTSLSPISPVTSTGSTPDSNVKSPFSPTGSLTTARAAHTATLLPNGKVLIAGGVTAGFQPLASAELYDPSTGMFTPTGSMTTARSNPTATLLNNGQVLIVGGFSDRVNETPIASAELYDPSVGTFTPTGSMVTLQPSVISTLLQDGRVFVAGSIDAEIYDPASGTFALTGAYVDANPSFGNAVTLLDGRVLLTGCGSNCNVGATELFDPRSGTFSTTGPMPGSTWYDQNTATLLTDGRVLFVGNDENEALQADAEIYDPAVGTFTSIAKAPAAHEYAAAVRLADGSVLITGGVATTASDIYLPANGTFASAGNMTVSRSSHTATLLPDGTVLIVGGYSGSPTPIASAEIYTPN